MPNTPLDKATLTFTPTEAGTYTMTVTASDGYNEATETVVITVTSGNTVSVPSTVTVAEAAGNAEIAITTTAAFGKALTFNVSYGGTSAMGASAPADGDYDNDEVPSVAFSATDTTIKITVPITDDTLDENDETFTVTIELAGGSELPAGFTLGNAMTTVTITDDDILSTSWTLSAVPSTVTEASGTTAVKVTAMRAGTATAATTTTLSISVAGVTAVAGQDFEAVTDFEITVATGATSGEASFNLVVIDDSVDESDETVAVRGTLAGSDFNGATITVTDNDEAGLTVTGSPVAVAEGSTGTYTVALDSQPTGSVTVTPTSDNEAVATVSAALTFATGNWSTAQTVTVTGVQDDDGVNDSTSVTHTVSGGGYGSVDVSDVTVNVTDDDGVTVSVSELTVAEGANNTYTVVLTSEPGGSVTVAVSSDDAAATVSPASLTFTTGNWSAAQTVTVTAKENNVAGVGGSATVSHAVTGYGTVTTANPVAVTVTDNDTLSTSWTLSADPSSVSESGGATTVTVTATRSGTVTAATSTTVSVSVGDGTAKAVEDFTAVSSFDLTVAAEATSGEATFRLAVIDDSVDEEDETIAVSGTLASNTITGTNITITDDDASPVLGAIDPVSKRVGQLVSVEARATDADNDPITYAWTRKAGETAPALPNTPLDKATLTFTPTEAGTYTMTVTASDGYNEATETVVITVTSGNSVSVPSTVTVAEAAGNAEIAITTTAAFGKALTFSVSYGGTSATGAPEPADGDYDNDKVPSVAFSATDTTIKITVPITDDTLDENDETFTVTIELAGGSELPAGFTLGNAMTTVTITDDDILSTSWMLSAVPSTVTEASGTTAVKVTAMRAGTATAASSTTLAISVAGGTATAGQDFTAVNDFDLIVAAGAASGEASFSLAVIDDSVDESDETAAVSGTLAGNDISGATITVTDNDEAGVTVTGSPLTVAEGATENYTVKLDTQPLGSVTVTPTSDNEAVATVSGALTFTTGNWSVAQTATVTGKDNAVDAEEDGSATVSHKVTGYGSVVEAGDVSVTVTDDDESPVLASLADVTLKLGQAVDIKAEATDGDGDTVSFAWTRKVAETPALPIGVVLPLSGSRLSFTPTAVGTYTMTVTASDGNGNEDTETVVIAVTPANAVSVPTTLTVGEGAGNAEITITTAAVFGKALTFNVSYGGTSATGAPEPADGDYDNNAVTWVAFSATDTTKKIAVPITDDTLDENDETFTVTIELAGGSELPAGFTLGNAMTTVTITDDDILSTSWTLSADPDSVAESKGTAKVKVTALRSGEATSAALTTVRVSVAGGTATAGIDFMGVSPFDITIAVGKKSGEAAFTLTLIDDNEYENDETITVSGALEGNTITGTSIRLTNDSDKPELSIAAPDAVAEGDSGSTDMIFTVTLEGRSQRQTTVDYAVDAGTTASAGGDYIGGAGTLTFAAGTTQKKITVAIRGDKSDEEDETVVIKLLNPDNATVATTATASGTIADDDASPVLAAIDAVNKRVGQLVSVTASAMDADKDPITYAWTRKASETVPALPDTPLDKATLTFTPTEAGTYTMTVTASDGNGNTDTETVAIMVTSGSTVSVPATLTVSEDAGTATVKVAVDRAFGERVIFNVSYGGSARGAPDASDGDYGNALSSLTFSSGDTEKDIDIPVNDDDVDEDSETIEVTIEVSGSLPGGFTVGNATTTVTVTDNDEAGVTVSKSGLTIAEGGSGTYTVVLNSQPTGSVTVTPSSGMPAVATVSGALTFGTGNWSSAQTVTVHAVNDDVAGGEGSAMVSHAVAGYGSVSTAANVSVAVTDNDTAGVSVSKSELTMSEGGSGTYAVALDSQPTGSVTVTPSSGMPAVATVSGALTFGTGNWSSAQTVTVRGVDNDVDGDDVTLKVSHEVTGYGPVSGADDVTVTVTDDDTAGVTVSKSGLTMSEGGSGTYTVALDSQPTGNVTVTPSSGKPAVATVLPAALTFTTGNWSSAQTVTVTGVDNDVDAADASATVTHGVAGYGSVPAGNVAVTVTDNDTAGVTVSPDALTVAEGATGTYTVKLDTEPVGSVTVAVASGDGEVATASPAALTFTTGNWSSAQTVTVTAGTDPDAENESATLTHTVAGYGSVTADSVAVTVTDDDTAGVTVSKSGLTMSEGGSGTYTVALDSRPTGNVTVTPSSGKPAVATVSGALTFSTGNWSSAQTVTVTGVDNDVDGRDVTTVTVSHGVTGYGPVSGAEDVTVSLTDDDTAGVTVSPDALTVAEGETGTYAVVLTSQPGGLVTVTPSSGNAAAAVSGALTFTTGNWSSAQTVTVRGIDNDVDGDDVTLTVSHGVTGYGPVSGDDVTVTVTDDDTAAVTVSPGRLAVTEGSRAEYTVVLATQPTGRVTVTPSSDDTEVATVSGALVFTTGNWSSAQTVTVTGEENSVAGGDGSATVSHRVEGYGAVTASSVTVAVTDNDTAGVTVSPPGLTVAEGGEATYTVVLVTEPGGSVTVEVSSGSAVATMPSALTFTAGNWNTAQTVTVSGVSDGDGADAGATVSHKVTGYGAVTSAGDVTVTVTDDDAVSVSKSGLTVVEGESGTYTVALTSQPGGPVTVTPSSGNAAAMVSGALTFTTGNWSSAQTVTVTGVDNDVDGDDVTLTVRHAVTGYGTVKAASVTVKVTDDDTAGVTVSPAALTIAEGAEGTYAVALDSQPLGSVTVEVTSDDADVAAVSGDLTFTTGNWDTAQTVTVSGVDNDVDGGDVTLTVSHGVTGYGTVSNADAVTVKVTDDDTAGVTVSPAALTMAEGAEGTYAVVLTSQPGGPVTVTPSSGNAAAMVSGALTFTTGNWSSAQTVTVTGVDNDVDGDDVTLTVSHGVQGYGAVTAGGVTVTVTDNDEAGVTVSKSGLTLTEGASGTYTVVLDTRPEGEVKVQMSSDNADVSLAPSSLTFTTGNWSAAQTVTVTGADDDVAGGDGIAMVTHAVEGYGAVSGAAQVSVKVTDDETAGVTLSKSELTVGEGGSGIYTVKLDSRPAGSVTVKPTSSGTAVATVSEALTFTAGNWGVAQTVTVSGVDNDVAGDNDTVTVSHTATGYGMVEIGSVTVAVTDDDKAGVTVSESVLTMDEGGSGIYTVKLDTRPEGSVTITPSSDKAAVAAVSAALTFTTGNWSSAQTVTVTGIQDDDAVDGTATVSHAVTGYGTVTRADEVAVKVADNDTAGVTVSRTRLTVAEGGSGTYTVVLDSQPLGSVTVMPTITGTVATVSGPLTFTTGNWSSAQTVTVTGADNDVDGGDGTATVRHGVQGYGAVTAGNVAVTVTDNDEAGVTVSKSGLTLTEGASGTYTVVLDTRPEGEVEVQMSSDNADVSLAPSSLTFTTGNWSAVRTVTVSVEDDADGADERAEIAHAVSGYGAVLRADALSVTVEDDETPMFSVSDAASVAEGGELLFAVSLSHEPGSGVKVSWTTADGSATAGSDYTAGSGTLSFSTGDWNTARTVTVSTLDDALGESSETVKLKLSSPSGGAQLDDDEALGTITDNDVLPALSIAAPVSAVAEGDTGTADLVFRVSLDVAGVGTVSVGYALDASRTTATSGTDIEALTAGTLAFSPGTRTLELTVKVRGDVIDEEAESVAVVLSDARGASLPSPAYASGSIADDDTLSTSYIFAMDEASYRTMGEGQTSAKTFRVWIGRDNPDPSNPGEQLPVERQVVSERAVSVSVAVGGGGSTATADSDYTAVGALTLTIAAGEQDGEVSWDLAVVEDDIAEGDETVAVVPTLSGASFTPASRAVTITDNDTAGLVLNPQLLLLAEPRGNGQVTVSLRSRPTGVVTVSVSSGDDAAVSVEPASLTFGTGSWNAAQTLTLRAMADEDAQDERVEIGFEPSSEGDSVYEALGEADLPTVTVSVEDEDVAGVTVMPTALTVAEESGTGTYTVVLDTRPTASVTVTPTSGDADAAAVSGALVFTTGNWDTGQTVTVTGVSDLDASNESLKVTHAVAGGDYGTVSMAEVSVLVTDDETPAGTPSAPVGVEATPGDGLVSLGWSDAQDASILRHEYRQRTGDGAWGDWTAVAGSTHETTHHVVGMLENGTLYGFQVRAVNRAGAGAASAEVRVRPAAGGAVPSLAGVTLSGAQLRLREGGGSVSYSVRLNTRPSGEVVVSIGTDRLVEELRLSVRRLTFGTGNWSRPQLVRVRALADMDDRNESLQLTHTVSGYGSYIVGPSLSVLVIDRSDFNDDIVISPARVRVGEGMEASYAVSLGGRPGGEVVVAASGHRANSNALPGVLSFAPSSLTFTTGDWDSVRTVTVRASEDANSVSEGYAVIYSVSSAAVSADETLRGEVVVNIADNDAAGLLVSARQLRVGEGGTASWDLRLATQPTRAVAVMLSRDTAVGNDADLSVSPRVLTFGADNWNVVQTVTFRAVADLDNEDGSARFRALASSLDSSYNSLSAEVTVTEVDSDKVPSVPTGLSAVAGDGQVELSWSDANNGSITVWQYRQRRGGGSWGEWTDIADSDAETTSHTVTGLDNGVRYRFRLRARNATGAGAQSAVVRATPSEPKPDKPVVSAVAGDRSVTLSWVAQAGVESWGYQYKSQSADWSTTTLVTELTAVVSGLTNGTEYTFRVFARDANNRSSSWSDWVKATPLATVSVPAAVSVSEDVGDATVAVSVDKAFGTSEVTFNVTYGDGTARAVDGDYGNALTTLTFSGTFTAKDIVIPITDDDVDEDDESFTVTIAVSGTLPAGYALGTSVTTVTIVDDDTAGVTVSASDLTVAEGETGTYTVKLDTEPGGSVTVAVSGASGDVTVEPATLTFTTGNWSSAQAVTVSVSDDLDLEDDAAVTLRHAVAGGGYDAVSVADVTVTVHDDDTDPVPGKPAGLTATAGDTQVTLAWTDPEDSSITGWQLRQRKGRGSWGEWTDIADSDAETTSHTVTGLDNDTEYGFRLRAENATGAGAQSAVVRATPSEPKPDKPVVSAVAGDRSVTLSWVAQAGVESWGYQYKSQGADWSTTTLVTELTAVVSGLTNGTEYTFRVFARDANNRSSSWSDWVKATPLATVSVPAAVSVSEDVGDATVAVSVDKAFGTSEVTFNVTYGDGTARAVDGDYGNALTTLTFSGTFTAKDIVIPITDDDVDEDDESFTVTIAVSGTLPAGYALGTSVTTVTIVDDDTAGVTVSVPELTVEEGADRHLHGEAEYRAI